MLLALVASATRDSIEHEVACMTPQSIGRFATRHALSIFVLVIALCIAGGYAALHMGSSLFPQTNFPRVTVIVKNGLMPADQMMARITRPIEESVKDIRGCKTIKSNTGRGSAAIDIFFNWDVNMVDSELYVRSRLAALHDALPPQMEFSVFRMTFSVFPIVGISLTSPQHDITTLWATANYSIKPQLLRIPGVARVNIVGGTPPEYRVTVDPSRLALHHVSLGEIAESLRRNNRVTPTGLFEQKGEIYSTVVEPQGQSIDDIGKQLVKSSDGKMVPIQDVANVTRSAEPAFSTVTAEGTNAVLLNVYSEPDGSTLDIANGLRRELEGIHKQLPRDMKLTFFYDQSLLVRESARSVWEAIVFGLILAIAILYLFLKNWGTTIITMVIIPVCVLLTIVVMKLGGMSFNLMTLGGIAAAIGLVIDDAIVVVETIYTKMAGGLSRVEAMQKGIAEIFDPLLGSTLTPVVVFIPLAFLEGIWGVFFRALAITMVVALIVSLLLALTLTPSLASWAVRTPRDRSANQHRAEVGGFILGRVVGAYEWTMRLALRFWWITIGMSVVTLFVAVKLYESMDSDFLPDLDEGGFVIDYVAPPGTAPEEVNRQLAVAEQLLRSVPEVESYSRRSSAALGIHIVEPNTGDFLVKLKSNRTKTTDQLLDEVSEKLRPALPAMHFEFEDILTDLIGDLTWSDRPIEIKLFSTDKKFLTEKAQAVEAKIKEIPGVVDTFSGVIYTGKTISLHVRQADADKFGLTPQQVANAIDLSLQGQKTASVLDADRVVNVRLSSAIKTQLELGDIPLNAADGHVIALHDVADVSYTPEQLELEREDLRQDIAVTARLEGRDLGGAMRDIRRVLSEDQTLPPGSIEYGGLYEQQEESSLQLTLVLAIAILLVFLVAMIEFRSLSAPIAIVFGATLSIFGIVMALHLTGISLNIITYLGAIIGMGIVHKNGILMLDNVEQLRASGMTLKEALVQSGRRRLRPVLMTSMAAALGMLPLAYGIGSGAEMLRPLAVAVIGAVCISVLLSLIVTPTAYFVLWRGGDR
jgi:CzcA family heavy metal efflux pump